MPPGERKSVEIRIRLYPGQDDDLIAWLEQSENRPHGIRTQAVKGTLRRCLGTERLQVQRIAPMPEHPADLSKESLAEIRQVVEASVTSAFGRFACTLDAGGVADGATTTEEDDPVEDLLDTLGKSLVLDDEP